MKKVESAVTNIVSARSEPGRSEKSRMPRLLRKDGPGVAEIKKAEIGTAG
jgi:hypothetical protein